MRLTTARLRFDDVSREVDEGSREVHEVSLEVDEGSREVERSLA